MPRLVDSKVDWLGLVPEDWIVERLQWHLKEINVKNNPVQTTSVLSLTNKLGVIPYEEKGNQGNKSKDSYDEYKVAYKDTIVANSMNILIGSVGYSNYYGCVSPVYYVFKESKGDNLRFINYIMQTTQFQRELRKYASGILEIRLRVSASDILKRMCAFPSIETQKVIADFLDKKCDEIDALYADIQAELDTLNEYRDSIISEAVTHGIDNATLRESGVAWCPRIPEHWIYTNPKALFKLRNQRASEGERQLTASQEYGIIYQDDFMEMTGNKVVTVEKDFSILKHVEPNDFVISMRSFQGGLEYSALSGSISSAYVMLIPDERQVYPPFYRWFFKSKKYINAIQSTTNLVRDGQAMRYANFIKVPLFIVPVEEQKRIAKHLDSIIKEIDDIKARKQEQLVILEQYKKSMIFEYVTGKKEVPEQ